VVIRPPDGDLDAYLASLARVRDRTPPVATLAPGHGRLMDGVGPVIDGLIAHRLARHARLADALRARGAGAVDDLLAEVYDDVTAAQLPVARFSLWAHLRHLRRRDSPRRSGGTGRRRHHRDRLALGGGRRLLTRGQVGDGDGGAHPLDQAGRARRRLDERRHLLGHHPCQLGEDGGELALPTGHRCPGVAGGSECRVQWDGAEERTPSPSASRRPPPVPKSAYVVPCSQVKSLMFSMTPATRR